MTRDEVVKQNIKVDLNDGYYHIEEDLQKYPDAWCIVVTSQRGPGKTYSSLWHTYYSGKKALYMKRTKSDVNMLTELSDERLDVSPFYPINRDKGTDVYAIKLQDGVGAFYDCVPETDDKGHEIWSPVGAPIVYLFALSLLKQIKGFDLSECEYIIMDEFVPLPGEVVRHAEGEQLLGIYMTIRRDALMRGRKPPKLILLSNTDEISTPITQELEIIDALAELNASDDTHMYIEDRGILLHCIKEGEYKVTSQNDDGIAKAMKGTKWYAKNFGGKFASNDFSNVVKLSTRRMIPLMHIKYRTHDWYMYYDYDKERYYLCERKVKCAVEYDLNFENDQKLFYIKEVLNLQNACMFNRFKCSKYSMYDLIVNYKKYFSI